MKGPRPIRLRRLLLAALAALAVTAIPVQAHRHHGPHHRPGCWTVRCDRWADTEFARRWLKEHPQPKLPFHTEASWFEDGGSLACPRVSGPGVAHHYEGQPPAAGLPCGTRVRICNGGSCVTATVEDRGPYITGRELDLDPEARDAIGCYTCKVSWGVVR